jgi:hypothetical protein
MPYGMHVVEKPLYIPLTTNKTMSTLTLGFPPIDALILQMTKVDYQKLMHQFLMLIVTIAAIIVAVSQFAYTKAAQWYHNGGKDLIVDYTQRAALFINNRTGTFDKLYALTVKFNNRVELMAHRIEDLVTI